jgi:hypothetical protein
LLQWAYSYFSYRRGARIITSLPVAAPAAEPLPQTPTIPSRVQSS